MDDEHDFQPDAVEREKFFTDQEESIWKDMTQASKGFDWTDERSLWDTITDAVPPGLPKQIPEDVRQHVRTAQHEALLAFRGLLDFWIQRTDPAAPPAKGVARPVLFKKDKGPDV